MCVFNINRTEITEVKAHGRQEITSRLHSGGRKVANGVSSYCLPKKQRPKSERVM